jgi:hypothetical protein
MRRAHKRSPMLQQLLDIIYRYYPRGVSQEDPRWKDSPEHVALIEASRAAGGKRSSWLDMLARLRRRFPGCEVVDNSLHLPAAWPAACYPGIFCLPPTPEVSDHRVGFQVSFLAPYYVLYSYRSFPLEANRPPATRLEPDAEERLYWDAIAREIESTYGSSPMPPEMGHVVVPDVQPGNRAMGEAMIYDCLFDDCPRLIAQDDQFGLAAQKEYAAHVAKKGKPHARD